VFTSGNDLVEDFADDLDVIRLDAGLLAGGPITAARALEFATVIEGDAVFDFGEGAQLTLLNVSDLSSLSDDIIFA